MIEFVQCSAICVACILKFVSVFALAYVVESFVSDWRNK